MKLLIIFLHPLIFSVLDPNILLNTGDSHYTRGSLSCESPRILKTRKTGKLYESQFHVKLGPEFFYVKLIIYITFPDNLFEAETELKGKSVFVGKFLCSHRMYSEKQRKITCN
jgi:hypothetical protein